ncbi:MAG: hypothetical protein ACRERD_21975 [Candidatus Binatia bacterium]
MRLKNLKGLHYIACLLQEPGREFHVLDLVAVTDKRPAAPVSLRGVTHEQLSDEGLSVAGPEDARVPLDAQARAAYRQRLVDLRAELEEAERFNDTGRAARAQTEMEFITDELTTSYGIHAYARTGNLTTEKARIAVTNRIRAALTKIQKAHSPLWRHLFASVKTGAFCSYRPEHPTFWQV